MRLALNAHHTSNTSGTCILNAVPACDLPLAIVHHSSGVKTPVPEVRGRMEKLYGRDFAEQDIGDWVAEAVKGGMDPLISTYLEALVEKEEVIGFPYLGES